MSYYIYLGKSRSNSSTTISESVFITLICIFDLTDEGSSVHVETR
jgi:hypothetical protein